MSATATEALARAADAARLAPSVHNSQPWRWEIGARSRRETTLDQGVGWSLGRDDVDADGPQRFRRVAAAAENIGRQEPVQLRQRRAVEHHIRVRACRIETQVGVAETVVVWDR